MRTILQCSVKLLALAAGLAASPPTALDRYVAAPDPHYRYEVAGNQEAGGVRVFTVQMTSQAWRSADEVDRPVWTHTMFIAVPAEVKHRTGLLYITSGSNDGRVRPVDSWVPGLARDTSSVVAVLRMVPNQPLTYAGDGKPRWEDASIAFTWSKFLNGGDDRWPMRLPMTKAAVRAMDTVTDFCRKPEAGGHTVNRYVVTGASKRGWTTWSVAAVDKRVAAIIPVVIDTLNVEKSFLHHFRSLGFWAEAVRDYENEKIMTWMKTPRMRKLLEIEDPYAYRDRLTMPKFIVNSSGDQFFLPDSSQFYFDELKGEKYLRYVPNTDHSLQGSDAIEGVSTCYAAFLAGTPRPRFSWKLRSDGAIEVRSQDRPRVVRVWHAANPAARDFRMQTIGPAYRSAPVEGKDGVYVARVPEPAQGWVAFFVELIFDSGLRHPFKFTTPVRILPDRLPYPEPGQ
ncbi:MAG: PhoPQ-activated pathogenicity-related family protein [Bryobacterales bacterium]|nr:PhoPQ-activated pathogenicity-related family protein [Bryobacterales bacterium]